MGLGEVNYLAEKLPVKTYREISCLSTFTKYYMTGFQSVWLICTPRSILNWTFVRDSGVKSRFKIGILCVNGSEKEVLFPIGGNRIEKNKNTD